MADESDSPNRATVALVSEQVKGVERLVDAGFKDVQRQLDAVASLPVQVTRLTGEMTSIKERVSVLEGVGKGAAEWRRVHLPAILVSIGLLVVAIVTLVTQLH